jgi:hypothetical protein
MEIFQSVVGSLPGKAVRRTASRSLAFANDSYEVDGCADHPARKTRFALLSGPAATPTSGLKTEASN